MAIFIYALSQLYPKDIGLVSIYSHYFGALYVQVLSESVAKALQIYRESEHKEDTVATEEFALLMDCFFDTFNVRDMTEGKKTRKTAQDPYWKGSN